MKSDRLDHELCLDRQKRIRRALDKSNCTALLILDRSNISCFFDYYTRNVFPAVGLVLADGPSVLCCRDDGETQAACDETVFYEATQFGSLKPELQNVAMRTIQGRFPKGRVACDGPVPIFLGADADWLDASPILSAQQRSKDADEIRLIESAVAAGEMAYAAIEALIAPGTREIDLFAAYQAAAVSAAGQPIGELGNDYRGGAPGGPPRILPLKAGDVAILDTGVMLRGYYSDLCRSYPVSGEWSPDQRKAGERIVEALLLAESLIEPGASAAAVFRQVHEFLDGYQGWRFNHHLGHGIGLHPVESPRINPMWDDSFQIGDVFTLEPGLYHADLRAGLRIENNYVLTEKGLRKLSNSARSFFR